MADLVISSLRRGMNNSDPPLSLPDDQCVDATNVEWVESMLGERRRGAVEVDLSGSADLTASTFIWFLYRHLPTTDETASELWVLGEESPSFHLCKKTTTWSTVTMADAYTAGPMVGLTLHGKLFLAYNSAVDRLHVWDGTTLRRVGMLAPTAAPTAANTGGVGAFTGVRYYRTREVVLSGTTVLRRGEPSPVLTWTPSGATLNTTVTKPADMAQSATHWEIEASTDNANFYRMARIVVATSTHVDAVVYATGYATTGTLSEESGDYTVIHSARFLLADEDRMIALGSFENEALASRVAWTPVLNDPGVGNDERIPLDPVSFRDLNTYEGGEITGAVGPVSGEIWIFKRSHVYKMVRTGVRASAYEVVAVSKTSGALPGSMVEAVDQHGSPCVYFCDPKIGPCRIGADGVIRRCGKDIWTTWQGVNLDAASTCGKALFYDTAGQVHWWVTLVGSRPETRLVLHVAETRDTDDGVRGGWTIWTGTSCEAVVSCLYSTNIDDDVARNLVLVPFVGTIGGDILRTDTGTTDDGTAYTASLQTKPYATATILHTFGVMNGALVGVAAVGAAVDLTATRDFGLETTAVAGIALDPVGSETHVIKPLDNISFSELTTVSFTIADAAAGTTRWELDQLALKATKGQSS